ncbi:hypothetical protein MY5147_005108, partial [Beauveria neobassiana]
MFVSATDSDQNNTVIVLAPATDVNLVRQIVLDDGG